MYVNKFIFSFFFLITQIIKAQFINAFNDEKCQLFNYSIKSDEPINIDFLNDQTYKDYRKIGITKNSENFNENTKLFLEFKSKFPKVFSDSCATFSLLDQNKVREIKSCDIKFVLVDKNSDFYIFKAIGFEVFGFLIFDEKNEKAIFTSDFPQIIDNGNYIYSINNGLNSTTINFKKKNNNDYSEYEIRFTARFRVEEDFLIKNVFGNLELLFSITANPLKLIEEGKNGKKYESDKNSGCNFKIKIDY